MSDSSFVRLDTAPRGVDSARCRLARVSADDRTLLTRAAKGDGEALEALMSRYASRIYRLAYGITRSAPDAEEVVQDVFLQIVNKGAGFEGRAALGSWIYRITTNVSLNKRRGKRRERAMPTELAAELERHLAGCEPCRAYLATYRKTGMLGAIAGRVDMPTEMQTRLRRFLSEQLRRA